MKKYGLVNVHLEPWTIAHSWTRGTAKARIIEPAEHALTIASAGWAPGTKGKVTGDVVILNVKTKTELQAYKGKLKNAIILRRPPTKVAPIGEVPTEKGFKREEKKDGTPGMEEAKKDQPKGKFGGGFFD